MSGSGFARSWLARQATYQTSGRINPGGGTALIASGTLLPRFDESIRLAAPERARETFTYSGGGEFRASETRSPPRLDSATIDGVGEPDQRPVILYVEDDADTFKIAAARLQAKYRLIWAQNDQEAVDLLAYHAHELYAVLMDIELRSSHFDGLDLTRLLRGLPLTKPLPPFARRCPTLPKVPVLVLTAYTARYTEADAHAVGASHFATKPIDFTRLNLALAQMNIAQVMRRFERTAEAPVRPSAPTRK